MVTKPTVQGGDENPLVRHLKNVRGSIAFTRRNAAALLIEGNWRAALTSAKDANLLLVEEAHLAHELAKEQARSAEASLRELAELVERERCYIVPSSSKLTAMAVA